MSKPCLKQVVKLNTALRDVEQKRKLQQERLAEAKKIIDVMVKERRPPDMINLARELMKCHSLDEVNDRLGEAAEYWMPPNNFGEMVELFTLAQKRAGGIPSYLYAREYVKKARKELDDCLKKQTSKRCGKMTTKRKPCQQRLGPDGVCQFHP